MYRVNSQEVFDRVNCNESDCDDCKYLMLSDEESGIESECTGNKFDCPQVDAKKDELEQFMADNPEEFELIMWTD